MNRIAVELDATLCELEPARARALESAVRKAMELAERGELNEAGAAWPAGYFEQTAGVLAGEEFERPPQGELPNRDEW